MKRNPVFTVGHSSRSIESFIGALRQHRVEIVADVRSSPYSARYPHFSEDPLRRALKAGDVGYVLLGRELGARRAERECYVDGQARYELIAGTSRFRSGIERVLKGVDKYRVALMCAERDPLDCHRAILVSRHLKERGATIHHILGDGTLESHEGAEERLIREEGLDATQRVLFGDSTLDSSLTQAYERRGRRIAYREGTTEGEDPHHRIHKEDG